MNEVAQYILIIILAGVVIWAIIEHHFPDYHRYLVTLWDFYIMKRYHKPINKEIFFEVNKQLQELERQGKRKYEQRLMRKILDQCGYFKAKMTGESNNKIRFKIRKDGKKFSNYQSGR